MDVTRKNFQDVLSTLPEVFNKAQFLTFDTEFTGLKIEGEAGKNYFDTLDLLYLKYRLKAETFMAIQFGVVAFFYDETKQEYTHQAYNFYLYPSSYSDINFSCQSKSIHFLIENGFDFNKVFKYGIPYLKESEIEVLLEKLEERQKRSEVSESFPKVENSSEHTSTINSIISNIDNILETKSKKSFTTEKYYRYVRKLIYNAVQQKYGSSILLETNKDETMTISVGFCADEIKNIQKENYLKEKNKILDEAGFCKVVRLIIDSKKLLIGHNLLLDILFTIRQFLTPLPNNYAEFKELVTYIFPKVIDTKYMATVSKFKNIKDTSLSTIVEYLKNNNEIPVVNETEPGSGYNLKNNNLHEAAYDAYITGLSFLAMCKILGGPDSFASLPDSSFLQPIMNKLCVCRMLDITFMNIGGRDVEPDRNGVYYLTFPKEWKKENILDLFKNYGFVEISWINSTSAFVKVKDEFIIHVEKNLKKKGSNYTLCTFEDYQMQNLCKNELIQSPVKESRLESEDEMKKSDHSSKPISNDTARKRKMEDIGEVIPRPPKKQVVS